jgi:hypothetical protein
VESLRESVRIGEPILLSEADARKILRMVEASQADPFSSTRSVLDDGDLKTLGVKSGEVGEQYGLRDHGDVPKEDFESEEETGELSNKQPLFGPESALVAPDCTPGGKEDIPSSVLKSIKVLSGEEETKEYESDYSQQRVPQEPRMVPQGEPRRTEPNRVEPGRVEPGREETPRGAQTERSDPASIIKVTRALREGSKKQHSRRVIKKILTDEQRAAISKLGGSNDSLD